MLHEQKCYPNGTIPLYPRILADAVLRPGGFIILIEGPRVLMTKNHKGLHLRRLETIQ